MPRTDHLTAKAATSAKYVPMLADPLNPLATEVGKAVVREVAEFNRSELKFNKSTADPSRADALGARITLLVAQVLEQSLSSRTAQGKALRMALIAKLATEEIGGSQAMVQGSTEDVLLTTAEAAARLEASRPYVSMLCNAGKLGEIVMTEGGHRRIRSSAVQAYLENRGKQHEGAVSPRQAGVEAGLYDHPDGHYVNVVREAVGTPKQTGKKSTPGKPARKSRS